DQPVQMDVDEVQPRRGPPVAEKPRLDVFLGQRLLEQWVVVEVDLTDRQVVGGSPVGIDQREFLVRQRISHDRLRLSELSIRGRRRVLGARGRGREPTASGDRLQAADGGVVAGARLGHRWRSYVTGHGLASQISAAYSAMVRSLENFPEAATFK